MTKHKRLAVPVEQAAQQRRDLWKAGFRPTAIYNIDAAVKNPGKQPVGDEWHIRARQPIPEAATAKPQPDATNTGVLCDGLRAIDIDVDDTEKSGLLQIIADICLGASPVRTRSNVGRCLLVYRAAEGEPRKRSLAWPDGSKIEVLGRGQQFAAYGWHPDGVCLEWNSGTMESVGLAGLTTVTEAQIDKLFDWAIRDFGPAVVRTGSGPDAKTSAHGLIGDIHDVQAAGAVLPNDGPPDWDFWSSIGMAFYAATEGSPEGYDAFEAWSAKSVYHDTEACQERWDHWESSPPASAGAGTLIHLAKQADPTFKRPSVLESDGSEFDASEPAPPPPASKLPVIEVRPGEIHLVANAGEMALIKSGLAVYQRGPYLVRPVQQDIEALKGRKAKTAALRRLNSIAIVDLLSQAAVWQAPERPSSPVLRRVDPPEVIAKTILERAGEWRLPRVSGVITTPTLRPDSTVLSEPGYDSATELFHFADLSIVLTDAVRNPTRTDAEAALALLSDLLAEFPFTSRVSQAVALSGLITPVVRGAMSTAPMHAMRANTAGSGKSYLVDVAAGISSGRPCPASSASCAEDELEKRISTLLLDGVPMVCLDNINGQLDSSFLCQAIERPLVSIRVLGRSEKVEVPARATLFCTGNNLHVRGDLTRRTLMCDLDAAVERPELRSFRVKPLDIVMEDRGRYVSACLIIARAYALAGRPALLPALASFEGWSDIVRSALVWLGCADPAASMETAREDDPELTELRAFVQAWRDRYGSTGDVTVKELIETAAMPGAEFNDASASTDLLDCLHRIALGRHGVNPQRLGHWLLKHRGRVVDGFRIKRLDGQRRGAARWTVEQVPGL